MTNQQKHTPGPWRIAEGRETSDLTRRFIWSDAESREEREDQSSYCIATVNERTFCTQLDANARLIAAAPELAKSLTDLLDAFRECVGHAAFDEFDASNPAVIAARAAIAKATSTELPGHDRKPNWFDADRSGFSETPR